MFYIIRIIFIVIVVLPLGLIEIEHFRRQIAKGKKYTKLRYYVIIYSITLSVFLLSALSFIPFEASFIRFDTVEDALKYKWIDTKNITVHYEDDCAFAARGLRDLYAFDKNNDGFGFVNNHAKKEIYHNYAVEDNIYLDLHAVYQKDDNKTFYVLNYYNKDYQEGFIDCESLDFNYFAEPEYDFKNLDLYTKYQKYAVCDGEPLKIIKLKYGDLQETLVIGNKIVINNVLYY